MTGFEIMEFLMKQDTERLRDEVFAGEDGWDEIVDAFIAEDGTITFKTFRQKWEEDKR